MTNVNEIVVTEAAEVTKEVVKNGVTLKVIAKYGVKAAVGVAAAYGLYKGVTKVVGLFKKPKTVTVAQSNDPTEFDVDDLPEIDGE